MSGETWATAAIVASISFACAIYYTATAWFAHRERMAKIQRGFDPDHAMSPPDRPSEAIKERK